MKILATALLVCCALQDRAPAEAIPSGKPWEPAWGYYPQHPSAWGKMHEGFLARTKQGEVEVIFFGDSITQGWSDAGKATWEMQLAPLKAVNYGIGGDSSRQVLWRIQHGEIDGVHPKVIVLMIGTNNLYSDANAGSDAEIAKGIETIVLELQKRLPATRILLLGLIPRQNEYFCGRVEAINTKIAKLGNQEMIRYLDMGAAFLSAPGKVIPELYVGDQLHLVAKGYERWAESMLPALRELLKR